MDGDFFVRHGDFPGQSHRLAPGSGAVWRKKDCTEDTP